MKPSTSLEELDKRIAEQELRVTAREEERKAAEPDPPITGATDCPTLERIVRNLRDTIDANTPDDVGCTLLIYTMGPEANFTCASTADRKSVKSMFEGLLKAWAEDEPQRPQLVPNEESETTDVTTTDGK